MVVVPVDHFRIAATKARRAISEFHDAMVKDPTNTELYDAHQHRVQRAIGVLFAFGDPRREE